MALSSRALRAQLQTLASRGEQLSKQVQAVLALASRSTTDLSPLLGPVAMLNDLYGRGMMRGLAWVMRDVDFPNLTINMQRAVLKQSALWASLWGHVATLPVRASAPRLETLRGHVTFVAGVAAGVRIEEIVNSATLVGVNVRSFWQTSSDTQVSLGRLLGYDYALTAPIDDPLEHWSFVLGEMAPLVPDVEALLTKLGVLKTPSYADTILKGERAVRITAGMTLSQVAAQVLGDASQWQALAQLNGLRSPYISANPIDQLGAMQGNRTLSQSANVGAGQFVLTDVTGLLLDQRIHLRFGDISQSVTVRGINTETHVVQFTPVLTAAFPIASVLTVYNPTYDVVGKVLQPGEYLVLPTATDRSGQAMGTLLRRLSPTQEAGLYGVDVRTTPEGNLAVTNGDLQKAEGQDNLTQALAHRLQTPRGSLTYHPLYGSDLHRMIGQRLTAYASFFAAIDTRQTLLRDPRAEEVGKVRAEAKGDRLLLEVEVTTTQQEIFPVRAEVLL